MITATSLVKTFRAPDGSIVRALDEVSLDVARGQVFGVVGQSGAGKSTLIRSINLLERPDSGSVSVDGQDLTSLGDRDLRAARQSIGMIFQHFNLLNNRTVAGNVEFALEVAGIAADERHRRSAEILDLVGLTTKAKSYPAELSGGQKQRVGIARALAAKPKVLLSDEATSALDPETTRSILDLIKSLSTELGLTVLLITHEMNVVKRICDSAALLESGRIIEHGPVVELISRPGSRLASELFPLGPLPESESNTVIDITFSGGTADRPVIAQMARSHNIDVSILGATVELIDGRQAGRTRLELPGRSSSHAAVIAELRSQGLLVEVQRGGAE